jgi:hypothetical protein
MTALALRLCAVFAFGLALASCQAAARPVVVELYESQGCSSCPPANANLSTVADRPDVIALNFAVTYWDNLGWKDTFAHPAFTARQVDYAHGLHHGDGVFTPQVVVDGRHDGVGADPGDFARLLSQGASHDPAPAITLAPAVASIAAAPSPTPPADVWLVRYDPRVLQVPIRAGENSGKTLPHRNIVRELTRLGAYTGAATALRLPPPTEPQLVTVILVQAPHGGPILAAAKG